MKLNKLLCCFPRPTQNYSNLYKGSKYFKIEKRRKKRRVTKKIHLKVQGTDTKIVKSA